jgi:hypothetical protein
MIGVKSIIIAVNNLLTSHVVWWEIFMRDKNCTQTLLTPFNQECNILSDRRPPRPAFTSWASQKYNCSVPTAVHLPVILTGFKTITSWFCKVQPPPCAIRNEERLPTPIGSFSNIPKLLNP